MTFSTALVTLIGMLHDIYKHDWQSLSHQIIEISLRNQYFFALIFQLEYHNPKKL